MIVRMKTYVVHMVNVSTYRFVTTVTVRLDTTFMKTLDNVKVSCVYKIHGDFPSVMIPGLSDILCIALGVVLGLSLDSPVKEIQSGEGCYPEETAQDRMEIEEQIRQLLQESLTAAGVIGSTNGP